MLSVQAFRGFHLGDSSTGVNPEVFQSMVSREGAKTRGPEKPTTDYANDTDGCPLRDLC